MAANNNIRDTVSAGIIFTNCTEVDISGGRIKTSGATVHGVTISSCTKVHTRAGFYDGGGSSTSSAGVSISGTSNDISVNGEIITGYQYPVRATGTVDYIWATGINGRGCAAVIDVAAAANTVEANNVAS
ncbi:MAG: hypothetical protein M9905_10870 [Rhizobiaceae bacterium]|nr:hypothetical protein [Rhizobiaceae bacterium]